jgi:hypothetical protein
MLGMVSHLCAALEEERVGVSAILNSAPDYGDPMEYLWRPPGVFNEELT